MAAILSCCNRPKEFLPFFRAPASSFGRTMKALRRSRRRSFEATRFSFRRTASPHCGLFPVASWGKQFLMGQIGISMPTGSTFQSDTTPVSGGLAAQLPYPMQTGSGTWDVIAAVTYQGQGNLLSWGAQAKGIIRTGTNDNGYRLGNNYLGTAWGAVKITRNFSASLRGGYRRVENITGKDQFLTDPVTFMTPGGPQVRPAAQFVPTADPNLRAGSYGDVGVGINFYLPSGPLHDLRLTAEGSIPVYQKLDGPQLETDWMLMLGAQYTIELGTGH